MFHYIQIKKSCAFQVCAIVVLQLHTAGTEDPITPQTHLGASISLNTIQIPPKYPPGISREVKMSTDNNMPQQTPPDFLNKHLTVSKGVWGCLFMSVGVCFRLLASWVPCRCLGVSEGCLGKGGGGVYGYYVPRTRLNTTPAVGLRDCSSVGRGATR